MPSMGQNGMKTGFFELRVILNNFTSGTILSVSNLASNYFN